ncbi:MAG: ABC transporter permease [Ardenticatenaceae bacterium]|nr:ABC transporter permease [Ardenticatenaceae bacterium]HBY97254.1 diguanylate cyclase [Chloroflexota bacterium]
MRSYLLRRTLIALPTLLAISLLLFGLIHLAPGGPAAIYASPDAGPEDLARIEKLLGTDQPLPVQYGKWLRGVLAGNWGTSFRYREPVTTVLAGRAPNTIQLMIAALVIAVVLAVPFGVISAVSKRRWVQYLASTLSMLGISIPTFWLGMMLLLTLSVRYRILPSGGNATIGVGFHLWDRLVHIIGPASVLATLYIAGWSRYIRSSMLDVMAQDYIRTARSKGLRESTVIYRHALRNALLPLVTLIGLQGGNLIGGAMITEVVFAWPGMGRLLAESLTSRDYPVLMAAFMIMAVLTVAGNLIADLTYGWVDPRIKLG